MIDGLDYKLLRIFYIISVKYFLVRMNRRLIMDFLKTLFGNIGKHIYNEMEDSLDDGEFMFTSNGKFARRMGASILNSEGRISHRTRNMTFRSDGSDTLHTRNMDFHSDGCTSLRSGKLTFHSDGNITIKSGKNVFGL